MASTSFAAADREGRFRALVEEIPAVTYIADFVGTFALRYVSPQCRHILGYDPDDWVADPNAWVRAMHPADRDRIVAEAEECIAAERPFDFEYRMLTADGEVRHFWEKTSIVRDADGRPLTVNGVMLDVTDLKVAQDAVLRHERERAAERAAFEAALRRQVEENRHQALHDDLTGLPNRRRLHRDLAAALATGERLALLLIDLDRFKEVNDVLGHHCGDELLCQVTARFRPLLRDRDLLARLGGDEFAVLLPAVEDEEVATTIAERLGGALTESFSLDGVPVYVEASIGVAISPDHGHTADVMLQRADVAMYAAKRAKAGWRMFEAAAAEPTGRVSRLAELRSALSHGQLVLHFQPKIAVATGAVLGVEALVRWQHPERGLLPPSDFVPLAEQTGLIRPLTEFVLDAGLAQQRAWRDAGHELTIAVNVASRTLADSDFPGQVAACLARHGVPASALELEITETGLMQDPERSIATLLDLHALGVTLAIDDFGTGYSSLSRLRDLPIDHLKIDRSFVSAMHADHHGSQIVKSTIALGQSLGMHVVAEGVEDHDVLEQLKAYGCDAAQGYFIAVPMPAEQLTDQLLAG